MSVVKFILKTLLVLIVLVAAGLFIIINYGAKVSKYECDGILTTDGSGSPSKVFIKIEEYRPFIVWADTDGTAWVERPGSPPVYYDDLHSMGSGVTFDHPVMGTGIFQNLSKSLSLSFGQGSVFDGLCKEIN